MRSSHFILLGLLLFCDGVRGAFLQSHGCNVPTEDFRLKPFLADVAIDEERKVLKFFMNSEAIYAKDASRKKPLITDLNETTNTYTTLHVQISFMGTDFVNQNVRFCDAIAVKNATHEKHENSPFPSPSSIHWEDNHDSFPTSPSNSESPPYGPPPPSPPSKDHDHVKSTFANSNKSIEAIYNNSTGNLVQCPLYSKDSFVLYFEANISDHYNRWGSYAARFSVISNTDPTIIMGCNKIYITPIQNRTLCRFFMIGIPVAVVLCIFINFIIMIWSEYQESSVSYLFMASTICNERLLKQLDASHTKLVPYLQFILFMGGLNLNYPGFFQPLIGTIKWCALLGVDLVYKTNFGEIAMDNVYITLNEGGLRSLIYYSATKPFHEIYVNFFVALTLWIAAMMILQQLFFLLRNLIKSVKDTGRYFITKEALIGSIKCTCTRYNSIMIVGSTITYFLITFAFPFLTLSFYAFSKSGRERYFPTTSSLRLDAFNMNKNYEELFMPPSIDSTDPPPLNPDGWNNTSIAFAESDRDTHRPHHGFHSHAKNTARYLSLSLASVSTFLWFFLVLFFIFKFLVKIKNFRIGLSNNVSKLYTSIKNIVIWGSLYHQYRPDRIYFVMIDLGSVFMRSVAVSFFSRIGAVQVSVILVVQVIYLLILFIFRPFFVGSFVTPRVWIPISEFVTILLCIPLIEELGLSDQKRTYIAYIQLFIHAVIVTLFLIDLFYCLVSTITSSIKKSQSPDKIAAEVELSSKISNPFHSAFDHSCDTTFQNTVEETMPLVDFSTLNNMRIEDTGDEYYRIKSEKRLQEMFDNDLKKYNSNKIDEEQTNKNDDSGSLVEDPSSDNAREFITESFNKDYAFREGDLIYRKYFCDDGIDPEVKQLWDSRHMGSTTALREPPDKGSRSSGLFRALNRTMRSQNASDVREFVVSRPKKLVVKDDKFKTDGV